MVLKKTAALLLALLFAAAALADTAIVEFISIFNEWAPENSAPLIDTSLISSDKNGWYIGFENSTCILGISFDAAGDSDIMMLEADTGDEKAVKALLNAWFVSDGAVEYSDIEKLINSLLLQRTTEPAVYMGWYVYAAFSPADENQAGKERVSIAVIWNGEAAPYSIPAPSETPAPDAAPSPTTQNGKPVYKA